MIATAYKPALIIPETIMRRPLSPKAKLVWGQIKFHYNRRTGQCNPGYALIGREVGISETSVFRAVRELRRAGLLVSTKHVRASSYVVTEFPQPVESVENGGKPPFQTRQNDDSRHVKKTTLDTSKRRVSPAASIYEPIELNLEKGNHAAAVKLEADKEPVENAAAAPLPTVSKKTKHEHRAAPPEPSEKTGQLQLDLEAPDELRARAAALVEELHAQHPQPGLPEKAIDEAERILRASEDVDAIIELIRRNHPTWKAHWEMLRPGRFIPQLWRWFHDGEWKRMAGKPVRHETFYEREERKWKENENSEYRRWVREYDAEQDKKRYG